MALVVPKLRVIRSGSMSPRRASVAPAGLFGSELRIDVHRRVGGNQPVEECREARAPQEEKPLSVGEADEAVLPEPGPPGVTAFDGQHIGDGDGARAQCRPPPKRRTVELKLIRQPPEA